MKHIVITKSFKHNLKKFKNHLNEIDVVNDVKKSIEEGCKKGEVTLKKEIFKDLNLEIHYIKLRLNVNNVDFRYILLFITSNNDYIPIILDLKKGMHGQNLGFNTNKKTITAIKNASKKSLNDYLLNSLENPLVTYYEIEDRAGD
jgi:hypothetical protein